MAETTVESPPPDTSASLATGGAPSTSRTPSPPPNCAICLGNCANKCYSDSCMHEFCFKCLLEWSKVKAVCPLCKQPFKSIIHNVKSIDEYEEYVIPQATSSDGRFDDFVWPDSISTSRHFQFRTTFTVDPRGELAIQQLLSTHSMTNSLPYYNTTLNVIRYPHDYPPMRRPRDVSTSQYRRSLYDRNLWSRSLYDITGRYRETSPAFFRENPGSKNRLVPFLQRELNALIPDDSIRTMNLVHRILSAIDEHPIRGRFMRQLLQPELAANTKHFLYEFYTYARCPYDLFGYDRHSQLLPDVPTIEEESSDSDVLIVSVEPWCTTRLPLTMNEVIEINSETSHDSDVVIREPSPPLLVDLANTSDDTIPVEEVTNPRNSGKSQMPAKLRYKRSRKNVPKKISRLSGVSSSDIPTSDSSSSSSDNRRRKRYKKKPTVKPTFPKSDSSQDNDCSTVDEDASERREKRKKFRKRKHYRKRECSSSNSLAQPGKTEVKDEDIKIKPEDETRRPTQNETSEQDYQMISDWFNNVCENRRPDEPGPSGIRSNPNMWFSDSDSD